jgi:hypothetical protein
LHYTIPMKPIPEMSDYLDFGFFYFYRGSLVF